jgi:hypothetical protein
LNSNNLSLINKSDHLLQILKETDLHYLDNLKLQQLTFDSISVVSILFLSLLVNEFKAPTKINIIVKMNNTIGRKIFFN